MSNQSTAVSVEHFAYIAQHTRQEDALLRELKSAATAAGIPSIWICPEQASFMQILLRATRAREVVEVGTLAGYSAIWMARALPPDGRLRTIEIEPRHADFASAWIARSDVKDRVQVLRGDARHVLAGIPARSVDACFIDADKEGYLAYLNECMRIARRGGLIFVDNAFAFGELLDAPSKDAVRGIRAFNDAMAARGDLQSIIVPFGDGCWVGVVL